jgi:hypothetical protein
MDCLLLLICSFSQTFFLTNNKKTRPKKQVLSQKLRQLLYPLTRLPAFGGLRTGSFVPSGYPEFTLSVLIQLYCNCIIE